MSTRGSNPIAAAAPSGPRTEQAAQVERLLRAADRTEGRRREDLLENAVEAGIPFARHVAQRYYRRGVEPDDLDQVAFEHLVKAAHSYRPSLGSDFRSYAGPTIRGGIRHYFRDHAWAVRLPRQLQNLQSLVNHIAGDLATELHRWPTHQEIADALDVDVEEIIEAEAARGCFRPSSLDAPASNASPLTLGELMADPGDSYQLIDQIHSLRPVVDDLSPRDRLVLRRRFVDHHTQAQIGQEIGVSQMHVSRLLTAIMTRFRHALTA